ncbi:MAG: tetratricopeptide repeat protein [Chitinivibrionales bacterium]|nr:tetratricopeptide repeat protein [Chitinivibrionales bacterium]
MPQKSALKICSVILLTFLTHATNGDTSKRINLLITRPVDVSAPGAQKNYWFSALCEHYSRFRLAAIAEIGLLPFETITNELPDYSDPAREISDADYMNLARKHAISYTIAQKFELTNGNKSVLYYAEVLAAKNYEIIGSVDETYELESLKSGLDQGYGKLLNLIGISLTEKQKRFFGFPLLSANPKSLKDVGELLVSERYRGSLSPADAALQYEDIINRDPQFDFAYFLCAQAFSRSGRSKKAARYYKNLADIIPDYGPLYHDFVINLRKAKNYSIALQYAKIGETKAADPVPILQEKALIYTALGKKVNASQTFEDILEYDKGNTQAMLHFARNRNDNNRPQEALKYARYILKKEPSNGNALFEQGRSYLLNGQTDRALKSFEKALVFLTDDPRPLESIGDVYLAEADYPKAADAYAQAMKLKPNELDIHLKAAKAYRLGDQQQQAADLLKKVEARFSTNTLLQKELGLLELALRDTAKAQRHLESAFSEQQNDPRLLLALGDIYIGRGRYDDAYRMFNNALPIIEDKNACYLALARLYLAKKAPAQATTYLRKIMDVNPDYQGVNRYFADARLMAEDKGRALAHYFRERELHGEDEYVQNKMAWLYFLAENWQQAKIEYLRLLRINPDHKEGLYRAGIVFLHLKDVGSARNYIALAEKQGKPGQEIYYQLGKGYALVGDAQNAVKAYQNCLDIVPKREEAWVELAEVFLYAGKDSAAAEAYIRLFELKNEKYKNLLADAGHIFFRLGIKDRARRTYDLFLGKKFVDSEVNVNLAELEYEEQKYDRVIALLKDLKGERIQDGPTMMMLSESYYATGQYAKALLRLDRVIEKNPRQIRAVELNALCAEKTNDIGKAAAMLEHYLRFGDTDKHQDYAYHLGELYQKLEKNEEAISRYRQNILRYPKDIRNYGNLAKIYYAQMEWAPCRKVLLRGIKLDDAPYGMLKMLARCYAVEENYDEAISWLEKYLTMAPKDSTSWQNLGKIYYKLKQYKEALTPLAMAVTYMPRNFDGNLMLGHSYYKENSIDKAVNPLKVAHEIKPDNTFVIELLADCYRQKKSTSQLIAMLKKWTVAATKNYDIRVELGSLLLDTHKPSEAIDVLLVATKLDNSNPRAYKLLVQGYEQTGNDKLRFQTLKTLMEIASTDPEVHYETARYHLHKGDDAAARPRLESAIKLNSVHDKARFDYAQLFYRRGEYAQALNYFEAAADIEPNNAIYLAHVAHTASLTGQVQKSLTAVGKALEIDNKHIDILHFAALVYRKAGQTVKSRQLMRDAISMQSDCAKCWEALGDAHIAEANYKAAVKVLMKAWELDGYKESVVLKLGRALSIDQKHEEATDFLKMVLSKNPKNSEAAFELAHVYLRDEEIQKAERVISSHEQQQKSAWTHLAKGELNEARGDLDAAWISFTVALRLLPGDPQVQDACGRIYLKKRQFGKAIEHFSKALAIEPHNPHMLVNLAKAYDGMNDHKAALELCEPVAKRFPRNSQAHYLMADISHRLGNHQSASEIARQGLEHSPKSPRLHLVLGHALAATDQPTLALDSYEQALKFSNKRYKETYRYIGNVYRTKLQNDNKAREYYQKYVKAGGKNVEARQFLQMN